jgi:cobalt/nickel transport protein
MTTATDTDAATPTEKRRDRRFLAVGFAVCLVLAGGVSYYASSQPDGLEKVAEDVGFIETAEDHTLGDLPLADYGVSGIDNERFSVGLAGILGVLVTAVVAGGGFILIARKKDEPASS